MSHASGVHSVPGFEKELSLGTSPQQSRLTQPKSSPTFRLAYSPSREAGHLAPAQARGASALKQVPTLPRDRGMSPNTIVDLHKQLDTLRAKLQVYRGVCSRWCLLCASLHITH